MRKRKQKITVKEKTGKKAGTTGITNVKNSVISVVMVLLPIIELFLFHFMKNSSKDEFVSEFIRLSLFCLVLLYVMLTAVYKNSFYYENGKYLHHFLVVFCIGLILIAVQYFLPAVLWLFLPLAVMLVLFSGLQTGIGSYLILVYLQTMLCDSRPEVLITYILIGLFGITLFSYLDIDFLFGTPMFTSLIFSFASLLAMDYTMNGKLTFDSFLYAAINLFISFMILTLSLKYLSYKVLHKNRDKYQEINDPEFILLTELKAYSQKAYYHAVHTAYFSEKIARKIGADAMLAKAGGYYHKIGRMRGNNNLKNALDIANEYNFPSQLVQLLKEYGGKNTVLHGKESAIVILSDAMVSSVMFLFEKDKNAVLDYNQIVDLVFQKQLESGILDQCQLTLGELTKIKKIFVEETLYYDFLR